MYLVYTEGKQVVDFESQAAGAMRVEFDPSICERILASPSPSDRISSFEAGAASVIPRPAPMRSAVRTHFVVLLFFYNLFASPNVSRAEPNIGDTRLLAQPALSAEHVAFVYGDDLWVADLDGKNVRRLTSDLGSASNPFFSPDGKISRSALSMTEILTSIRSRSPAAHRPG